jgi:hypothetical protein
MHNYHDEVFVKAEGLFELLVCKSTWHQKLVIFASEAV